MDSYLVVANAAVASFFITRWMIREGKRAKMRKIVMGRLEEIMGGYH